MNGYCISINNMKYRLFPIMVILLVVSACGDDHFITDRSYRKNVEQQFEKRKILAQNRAHQLFDVFEDKIALREKEALKFLYAYSPLSDLADYQGSFFLKNIRSSFAARDTFSWGKQVPENLFRHFVIPIRINNENLDSSRWVFFNELKDRIKHLSMKDAVLEVNHWCHEKVQYRGSDGRTSSPLATVKTAYGRCGEESTFTVAALRSVCIPARQCYTPRWAHCDDNHAWVEVWVDGKWHFIGACEPDADLDLAWFTKPAKRAMLVNTTVFGDYTGPEETLLKDSLYTRINVLENYAPVKQVFAKVVEQNGKTVDSAVVEFQLYNYAEFYPLHRTFTDKKGICSFKTGFGDLLVWAAKGGRYGYGKLDVRTTDTITLELLTERPPSSSVRLSFSPPKEEEISVNVSDSARKLNSEKLVMEDKLRSAYEATFIDSLKSLRFARLIKLNPDSLWYFLHSSRGNWRELTEFITGVNDTDRHLIFPLFSHISEKDLRDVTPDVLSDAILTFNLQVGKATDKELIYSYVLSPRVDNEWLKPCRGLFLRSLEQNFIETARKNPVTIVDWIKKNIVFNQSGNYSRAPITPAGVFELRVADNHSADIFFTALCRSLGIPARLDPATKIPQYFTEGKWNEVYIFNTPPVIPTKGRLMLTSSPENEKRPEYTINYTIEELKEGFFRTLDYEGSPLVSNYPCTIEIPAGRSLMVTGTRLNDGTVLAGLKEFEVTPGQLTEQVIELSKAIQPEKNFGKVNPQLFDKALKTNAVIVWLDYNKEPSKRFIADLKERKKEVAGYKVSMILVFPDEAQMKNISRNECSSLPSSISYSFAETFLIRTSDIKISSVNMKNLPVVIYLKLDGNITYLTEAYRPGMVDELLQFVKKQP